MLLFGLLVFLGMFFAASNGFAETAVVETVACACANCGQHLTKLQVFAGFITWMNIMWVFAIVVGVVCLTYLCWHWIVMLLAIFVIIPAELYEILMYVASIGMIIAGKVCALETGAYIGLTGCLLFGGALIVSAYLHEIRKNECRYFTTLFVAWSIVAVWYTSTMIGFIAVMALMSALGFFAAPFPLGYVIGFQDDDSLERATSAAFIVLAIFVFAKITGVSLSFLNVFEPGGLWMGSLVGYLGILIASSKFHHSRRDSWGKRQVISIILFLIAVAVGTVWNISALQKFGGTFFALYLVDKTMEIPVESAAGYAYLGLFTSGMVYIAVLYIKSHLAMFQPYLLF